MAASIENSCLRNQCFGEKANFVSFFDFDLHWLLQFCIHFVGFISCEFHIWSCYAFFNEEHSPKRLGIKIEILAGSLTLLGFFLVICTLSVPGVRIKEQAVPSPSLASG